MNRCSNDESVVADKNLEKSSCMVENLKTSIRPNPNGDWPQVDPTAHIDPTARIIGNVYIGPEVFIGPNAVIRADETDDKRQVRPIKIEAQCNVQDGVIIHALGGTCVTIERRTSLSHGCTVHGPCTVGKGCFVGFRAVIYDAILGDEVFVGAGVVIQGVKLAPKSLVPPAVSVLCQEHVARFVSTISLAEHEFMARIVAANLKLASGYRELKKEEG
jgi:carbonic anhydrase/acetyltransferase-like protein (isoleucine patch superfamily)